MRLASTSTNSDTISVLAMGLCTPVGLTRPTTIAAMAAGLNQFTESRVLDDEHEPVRASMLTALEFSLTRTERMRTFAVPALKECLANHVVMSANERIPVFLALSEEQSGSSFDVDQIEASLQEAVPDTPLDFLPTGRLMSGRAGFFEGLSMAFTLLKSRRCSIVLLGGIDSMCDLKSLVHLVETGRTLGAGNIDGVIPGEGAGFALLSLSSKVPSEAVFGNGKPLRILGVTRGNEQHHFHQKEPNLAHGLADVFKRLYQHPLAGKRRVDHLFSCQTGETFWEHEFTKAYLRNPYLFPEPLRADLIAESLGDAGSVSGMVQLAMASHALKKLRDRFGGSRRALLYGSSDMGRLGACIVESFA